jgi:hypothetical protein
MSFRGHEIDGDLIMREPVRGLRIEASFRRGVQHGRTRDFVGDELVSECSYIDGVRDGICWSSPMKPLTMSTVLQYHGGKRTGVWAYVSEGKVMRSWVYGDDILLAADGRSLPPPPPSIDVDGTVILRTSCGPVFSDEDACPALVEAYQYCERDAADRPTCHENAKTTYRHMKERQSRRHRARHSDEPLVSGGASGTR